MQLRKSNDFRRSAPTLTSGFERTDRTQSVQPTCGILRGLQAFFWPRVFPALKQNPRARHGIVPRISIALAQDRKKDDIDQVLPISHQANYYFSGYGLCVTCSIPDR